MSRRRFLAPDSFFTTENAESTARADPMLTPQRRAAGKNEVRAEYCPLLSPAGFVAAKRLRYRKQERRIQNALEAHSVLYSPLLFPVTRLRREAGGRTAARRRFPLCSLCSPWF